MTLAIVEQFRARFGRVPEIIARAPGRIEFIGNHTDYNGGLVLGAAIEQQVEVAIAGRTDGRWIFASEKEPETVTVLAGAIEPQTGNSSWANYPLGVLYAFRSFQLLAPQGFDYMAAGNLPVGAGLSSSAAIELASALAFLS